MDAQQQLSDYLNTELMALLGRMQSQLPATEGEGALPVAEVLDIYSSALTGHLFSVLLTGMSPGFKVNVSPDSVTKSLNLIGAKLSAIAQAVDATGDYRFQILRRDRGC